MKEKMQFRVPTKYKPITSICFNCLCEVCTRHHCPRDHPRNLFYMKYSYGMRKCRFCLEMLNKEMCPTTKCDYFVNKQIHKVYYIKDKRKPSRYQSIMDQLASIKSALDKMGK